MRTLSRFTFGTVVWPGVDILHLIPVDPQTAYLLQWILKLFRSVSDILYAITKYFKWLLLCITCHNIAFSVSYPQNTVHVAQFFSASSVCSCSVFRLFSLLLLSFPLVEFALVHFSMVERDWNLCKEMRKAAMQNVQRAQSFDIAEETSLS